MIHELKEIPDSGTALTKVSFSKEDIADKPQLSKLFQNLWSITGVKAPESEPVGTDALTVGGLITQLEAVEGQAVCSIAGLGKVTRELPLINYNIIK